MKNSENKSTGIQTSFLAAVSRLFRRNKKEPNKMSKFPPPPDNKKYSVKEAIFWQPTGKVIERGLTRQAAEDMCENLKSRYFTEIDYYISEEE